MSTGGAEKAAARLSVELDKLGYSISIITFLDDVVYNYQGKLVNLGIKESSIKPIRHFQKLSRLQQFLKQEQPSLIIDFRMRNHWFKERMLYTAVFKKYAMCYVVSSSHIAWHLPKGSFFKKVYNNAHVVGVSKYIASKLAKDYALEKVHYIPNFYNELEEGVQIARPTDVPENYIVAVGSLRNAIKQFDQLIATYERSRLPKHQIALVILGEGEDRENLESLISALNLTNKVLLLGYKSNVEAYLKYANFLVLSSKLEGFPNVILESLSLGTPVVSFDCVSGPSEMITDKENGLLVANQNFGALRKALDDFSTDKELYNHCKTHAQQNLTKFSTDTIMRKWLEILK
ncbi:hypothetical protein Y10_23730 [Neptunitalea sp. Y10]|uniref:Glycosyltransferase n=1 Tax=Neptunitalea lumnitzerae TaxID=2965509 RepID=A0ABQ5MKR4_9FLAO|nr:hypothetical protein Y10_23730 [Neptunitalea sp. Y10]